MQAMGIEFISIWSFVVLLAICHSRSASTDRSRHYVLAFGYGSDSGDDTVFKRHFLSRRPLMLFYINAGERLAALLLMSLIVGLWR